MLVIFIVSILMIVPSVCLLMASNYETHTNEWRDERFIEWLKRPLPECNSKTIGKIKCRGDEYFSEKYWHSGWIVEIFPNIKNSPYYFRDGERFAYLITNVESTSEDIIAFLDKPNVSSLI